MTSQTSIHQHSFEGAFTVLSGHSLESVYDFIPGEAMGEAFWGELKTKELCLLTPGQVRPIVFRDGTIHRVLHLSKPTVSLVLRTGKLTAPVPQNNYDFGCLATNGFPSGDIKGKLRVIEWYLNQKLLPTYPMIQSLLPHGDFWHLLSKHEHTSALIKKISFLHHDERLLDGMQKQAQFQHLLQLMTSDESKMLLIAFEHFAGEEAWTEWVLANLKLTPEVAKKKTKSRH